MVLGYYIGQKSPKNSLFTFRRGAIASQPSPGATPALPKILHPNYVCHSTKNRLHSFEKRKRGNNSLLFRAVVKFFGTNRLYTIVEP